MEEINHDRLNSIDRSLLSKFIQEIAIDPETLGLIRFGSSVHSVTYRDIDLCIVMKNKLFSSSKELKYRLLLPEKFDVHIFQSLPLYIQQEVLKYGIYEYIKDYDDLFDVCVQSIKEFVLFEPHYRMYLELIKNS